MSNLTERWAIYTSDDQQPVRTFDAPAINGNQKRIERFIDKAEELDGEPIQYCYTDADENIHSVSARLVLGDRFDVDLRIGESIHVGEGNLLKTQAERTLATYFERIESLQ